MTEEVLQTLRQLSAELHLPESTIRYYRDAFLEHIPSVGTGRRRRYPPNAVAVLRSIAQGYAAGQNRSEIVAAIHHAPGAAAHLVSIGADKPSHTVSIDEVSNLDLLGAILDGEREQRDALWQMAKEIVRLTQVLEGQDKVLTEIADRAGIVGPERRVSGGPAPMAAIAAAPAPAMAAQAAASPPAETVSEANPREASLTGAIFGSGAASAASGEHTLAPQPAPVTGQFAAADGSMEKLREELEAERALVERLREAKLQLEHRAADAEAALDDKRPRRSSVISRLLGNNPDK